MRGKKKDNSNPNSNLSPFNKLGLGSISQLLKALGPGVITGAADDDPSGIATYSQAGAKFGLGMLWMTLSITYHDCYTGNVCKNRSSKQKWSSKRKWFGSTDKERILY